MYSEFAFHKYKDLPEEVGVYKRKQESKKFFLVAFLVESVFSLFFSFFFLGRFLGRKRFFLFSYILVFFHKFPPQFLDSQGEQTVNESLIVKLKQVLR